MSVSHPFAEYLDEEMLLASAGDDVEFALELVDAFRVSTDESLRRFEEAVRAERWKEAALYSHSMKGAAKTLGLNEFGDFCSELEIWCKTAEDSPRPVSEAALKASHEKSMGALDDFARRESA